MEVMRAGAARPLSLWTLGYPGPGQVAYYTPSGAAGEDPDAFCVVGAPITLVWGFASATRDTCPGRAPPQL